MFSFDSLYNNYKYTSPDDLKLWIEDILEDRGLGSITADKLSLCFKIAEEYTNNHQKEPEKCKFRDGVFIRASGEPYINHALRVALILLHEKLYTNVNVIYAAIMHDLFEDTTYTYEQAASDFSVEVADLIKSVTNVTKDQNFKKNNEDFKKEMLDYSGIIQKCSAHRLAFYIKFADRLDNLRTLDAIEPAKQKKKIMDTKKYLIPLMNAIGAQRFKSFIRDAIFKAEESMQAKNKYAIVSKQFHGMNPYRSVDNAVSTMKNALCRHNKKFVDLFMIRPSIYEIYSQISAKNIDYRRFTQSDITYDLYLIIYYRTPKPELEEMIMEFLNNPELEDITIERIGKHHLYLIDQYCNHYRMEVVTHREYNISQYGDIERKIPVTDAYNIDDDITDENKITVLTTDDRKILLKEGSTVIDFAFKLSEDHGIRLAGAIINGEASKDLFEELHNRDVVEIVLIDDGRSLVQVNWLLHCETNNARYRICRHLQNKIDGLLNRIDELELPIKSGSETE